MKEIQNIQGYTQDNYYIGKCVLFLKRDITSLMEQKQMIFFEEIENLDAPNNIGYWNEMGSVDEIKQFTFMKNLVVRL